VDAGAAVGALYVAAVVAAAGSAAAAPAGAGAAGARLDDLADTIKLDELPCGHLRPAHGLPRRCLLGLAQAARELENVGDVLGDIVAGAVAADDDVAHGE
jgi:hypothetical protein